MKPSSLFGRALLVATVALAPLTASATTVYITSGSSWTVPVDFNAAANSIEAIGGGGGGATPAPGSPYPPLPGGGGGGAYSKVVNLNLTPSATVSYGIGAGGAGQTGTGSGAAGGDTWFSSTGVLLAKGGQGGTLSDTGPNAFNGGAGGQASNGVGTTKYSGGQGGPLNEGRAGAGGGAAGPGGAGGSGGGGGNYSGMYYNGGGGGGAGGSSGAGGDGFPAAFGVTGDLSGPGGAGAAGGGNGGKGGRCDGGSPGESGVNGAAGTLWNSGTMGPGGGGGASGICGSSRGGGAGGLYGGGGGAGSGSGTVWGGNGAQGLIVISYTAGTPPPPTSYTTNYTYDRQGQVRSVSRTWQASSNYCYDAAGNRTAITVGGGVCAVGGGDGVTPAPGASDTSLTVAYNTSGAVTLLGTGSVTSYAIDSGPSHGGAVLSGATATYTPTSGYFGPDLIYYHAVGPGGNSPMRSVNITVQAQPSNQPPVANTDSFTVSGTIIDRATGCFNPLTNDTDPNSDSLTITGVSGASNLGLTYSSNQVCVDTPARNAATTFTYTVSDGHGGTATGTVNLTIHRDDD